jgi:hypothetical protein
MVMKIVLDGVIGTREKDVLRVRISNFQDQEIHPGKVEYLTNHTAQFGAIKNTNKIYVIVMVISV